MSTNNSVVSDASNRESISGHLAEFAADFRYECIPPEVRERAKYLLLDAIGIALASSRYDFASCTIEGLIGVQEQGACSVIGLPQKLPLRDAALMNGLLIHGLDYDDTHVEGVVHPTASAFPCALGVAEHLNLSGRDMLAAYILGVEVLTRLGVAAKGTFQEFGFHVTGIAAHFSTALQAGWQYRLSPRQLAMAQGIAGSTASGIQEFLEEGAWSKRLHPGWAVAAGITAALLAKSGFVGPRLVYEGRFGLFKSHLHEREANIDYSQIIAGLGTNWKTLETSIKPFPICHLIHACADAALTLRQVGGVNMRDVRSIRVLLPEPGLPLVAEPESKKRRPGNSYDAMFSAHFVVATSLLRGRFGLAELEDQVLKDPEILALADKIQCEADPRSAYPKYYSGGLVIETGDGRTLEHHELINRGCAEKALENDDIVRKFFENARLVLTRSEADRILTTVLRVDEISAREFAALLSLQVRSI